VNLFHYLILLNSLLFVFLIFEIRSCCLLFSLHKPLMWNLRIVSWSARKTKQNCIFVCEILCLFEILIFWSGDVLIVVLRVKKGRRRSWPPSFLVGRGSHLQFCPICCCFCTPIFISTPPFPFKILSLSFYCTFFICFIYLVFVLH